MKKPDTKEMRDNARALRRKSSSNDDFFYTAFLLEKIADFIDSLEGKHICDWPKWIKKDDILSYAKHVEADGLSMMGDNLRALAAIAPEAPKKRKVEIWQCTEEDRLAIRIPPAEYYGGGWRKVGECEIDE
jgi:hypothetical protein